MPDIVISSGASQINANVKTTRVVSWPHHSCPFPLTASVMRNDARDDLSRRRHPHHVQVLQGNLDALGRWLIIDGAAGGGGGVGLGQLSFGGAVNALLEDGLDLVEIEFGLEVTQVMAITGGVGSATGIGKIELIIEDLVAGVAPITCQRPSKDGLRFGEKVVRGPIGEVCSQSRWTCDVVIYARGDGYPAVTDQVGSETRTTYQLPLPLPLFLIFLGSSPT